MPYIGNTIRAADDYRLIDDISSSFNGSTTSFALQVAGSAPVPFPKSPQQVLISVNGVIQEPDPTGASGFNLVGTNIVFSSAPTNGHAFFGIIYATADYLNAGGNFPSGSTGAPSLTFIGDEDTGIYRKSSGSVGFVSNATEIANTDSNGITISSGNLILGDSSGSSSDRVVLGASSDLQIYHSGSHSFISNTTGTLQLENAGNVTITKGGSENMARFIPDGAVELYHDNSKKFETTSGGVTVTGKIFADSLDMGDDERVLLGTSDDLQVYHDGSNSYVKAVSTGTGDLYIFADGKNIFLRPKSGEDGIKIIPDGAVELYHDNSEKLATKSSGIDVTGDVDATGHIEVISDSKKFMAGASNDARMYHDGTDSYFDNVTGNLYLYNHASTKSIIFGTEGANRWKIMDSGHYIPNADSTFDIGTNTVRVRNGYFDTLYGDGSNLTGVSSTTINNNANNRLITGSGTANTLEGESDLTFDGSTLLVTDASLRVSSATPTIDLMDSSANPDYSISNNNGVFRIRDLTNTNNAFLIDASDITVARNIIPYASNTYNLGSSSSRWANLFVNDLKMSNKGKQNEVDGTWGDYTIQEGHEDLFLINHRTGKKFKFNLTEVG